MQHDAAASSFAAAGSVVALCTTHFEMQGLQTGRPPMVWYQTCVCRDTDNAELQHTNEYVAAAA